jgi:hypothetical protein
VMLSNPIVRYDQVDLMNNPTTKRSLDSSFRALEISFA